MKTQRPAQLPACKLRIGAAFAEATNAEASWYTLAPSLRKLRSQISWPLEQYRRGVGRCM